MRLIPCYLAHGRRLYTVSISVLIPAHNCSRTIRATLDSVLAQTVPPDEVLVMDDGSTDDTFAILDSYRPRITVLRQPNKGVASTRNALVKKAAGDLVAFVDSDDLWHPRYLDVQRGIFQEHPEAVASFTWHVNFHGYDLFDWDRTVVNTRARAELIPPLEFLKRYNKSTGFFACMSYCCVPKNTFMTLSGDPFGEGLAGAEDSFLCTRLALLGPVVFSPLPLVAYRVTEDSLSSDRPKMYAAWVDVFCRLRERYDSEGTPELVRAFRAAHSSKRRAYAKILMGTGKTGLAREQIRRSLTDCSGLESMTKSLALLSLTYMPGILQPKWPSGRRGSDV